MTPDYRRAQKILGKHLDTAPLNTGAAGRRLVQRVCPALSGSTAFPDLAPARRSGRSPSVRSTTWNDVEPGPASDDTARLNSEGERSRF